MFSSVRRPDPPPVCVRCDMTPLTIASEPINGDNVVRVHFSARWWCKGCVGIPCPWASDRTWHLNEATWTRLVGVYSSAGDKYLRSSMTSALQGVQDRIWVAASLRLAGHCLSNIQAREVQVPRLWQQLLRACLGCACGATFLAAYELIEKYTLWLLPRSAFRSDLIKTSRIIVLCFYMYKLAQFSRNQDYAYWYVLNRRQVAHFSDSSPSNGTQGGHGGGPPGNQGGHGGGPPNGNPPNGGNTDGGDGGTGSSPDDNDMPRPMRPDEPAGANGDPRDVDANLPPTFGFPAAPHFDVTPGDMGMDNPTEIGTLLEIVDGNLCSTEIPENAENHQGAGSNLNVLNHETRPDPTTAVPTGPPIVPSEHFKCGVAELKQALMTRVDGKTRPFKPSPALLTKLQQVTTALKECVLTHSQVRKFRDTHQELKDLCSKKWNQAMIQNAIDGLYAKGVLSERIRWKAQIKAEVLPKNKKKGLRPRIIANCGEEAQLCALVTLSTIEHLLFEWFDAHTVKHRPKLQAVERIFEHMGHNRLARIFEGDGSAWDITVSTPLKNLVENQLIWHVASILFEDGDVCESIKSWFDADMAARKAPKANMTFSKGAAYSRLTIRACRYSGDRGTSVLNWIVNFASWTSIILDDPRQAVQFPNQKMFRQHDGTRVMYNYAYEGDDSIVETTTPKSDSMIVEAWESMGFNMTLFERQVGDMVVFTGMQACRRPGGLGQPIPEPKRNVASAAWSVNSPSDDEKACSAYARAHMYKNYYPLAKYFAMIGDHWRQGRTKLLMDRETQFRIYGNFAGERYTDSDFFELNCDVDMPAKDALVADVGLPATNYLEGNLLCLSGVSMEPDAMRGLFPPRWYDSK